MKIDFKERFKLVEDLDEDKLKKAFELVLNPPIETVDNYTKHVRGFNEESPPQRPIEYIPLDIIEKRLGNNGVEIFSAVDLVVSLIPRSMFSDVDIVSRSDEGLEIIRRFGRNLRHEYSNVIDNLRFEDLFFEDFRKEKILLIIPSQRQLDIVLGKWRKYAWREKTIKGVDTPKADGWIRDIVTLADALRGEGVKIIILADKLLESKLPFSKGEILYLDLGQGLCKIGYPRDSSLRWFSRPIISNMALSFRRGEEDVITEAYWKLGLIPLLRFKWVENRIGLKRVSIEGGNFFMLGGDDEAALITGIGVRGSDIEVFSILDSILPREVRFYGVPLAGYLRDWITGAVHLDVAFAYIGETAEGRVALVDPSRIGFYSIIEYERVSKSLRLKSFIDFVKEFNLLIDEPPRRDGSPITMINALNLSNGKLVVDSFNRDVNSYLEKELKIDLIEVDIPHIEAGGGGPRCATRDIPC
ncbi:MAG: hypothetical protein ABDH32_02285 [Candidatus Caldarchaeales archaeon]